MDPRGCFRIRPQIPPYVEPDKGGGGVLENNFRCKGTPCPGSMLVGGPASDNSPKYIYFPNLVDLDQGILNHTLPCWHMLCVTFSRVGGPLVDINIRWGFLSTNHF